MLKLTNKALTEIKEPKVRAKLVIALGVTDQTIIRMIKGNSDDLTKMAAMQVIREETGLTDEEILEEETIERYPQS